jgi:ATP-binding cassette subfamily C protein
VIEVLRQCLSLLPRASRREYLLLLPLSLLTGLAEMGATAGIFALITVLTSPTEGLRISWVGAIARQLPWQSAGAIVVQLTVLLGLFYIVRSGVVLVAQYYRIRVSHAANAGLSCDLLRRYLSADYPFHFSRHSSDLIRNCTAGVDQSLGILFLLAGLVTDLLMAAGMLAVLVVTSPGSALALGAILGITLIVILRVTRRTAARYGEGRHAISASILRSLQQALGGVKELKVLGRERFFYDEYVAQQRQSLLVRYLGVTLESAPSIVLQTVLVCGALALVAALTIAGQTGVQSLPVAAVFGYVGMRVLPMANSILGAISHIRASAPAVQALYDDTTALRVPDHHDAAAAHTAFTRSIVLDGVSYTYPAATRPAVADVSLTIRRGESIGIIGPTGAGKSTLMDIILGLLPPTRGRITVDDVDLSRTTAPWKRRVGYVPQHVYLIDDTVQRNIALGIPDAEIDPARLSAALSAAQLDRFVAGLPQGLQTPVGERGILLSGGERQRLAIARALYHDPDVLIFDEATASLDVSTEAEINRTITALHDLKTVIVIAHRLSSVRSCDRLVWLANGHVVDSGSFDELHQRRADFRALVELAAV